MIFIYTKNSTYGHDSIDAAIRTVIELDREGIEFQICFNAPISYKCSKCHYLYTQKKELNPKVVCPGCQGKLIKL